MDRQWIAVEKVVQDAFADKAVLEDPPKTPDDWMWLGATVTDFICAAFETVPRTYPPGG